MFGIIISVIVLITMGYLILKNYKPQVVLAAGNLLRVFEEDNLSELFYRSALKMTSSENFGNKMNYLFK